MGNTVTVDATCSGCKRVIRNVTRAKNGAYVCPNCEGCADGYKKAEKKGAVCRACGEVKLVPKDTDLENGFYCNDCAALKREYIQKQIKSGKSSGTSFHAIEN
ncbi:PREDICTED: uncharacterized protein LOC109586413 [Amphimedon queenslandica]|uniref:Uncharacterized protein n=1 Tax=Amphimedon queenslandica TaxID=400682 RepID=A0A1X7VS87_AMPQE|nr:PREDICTED: uncharacterized protein LOC109586413 [Amphimedon queenslandica]|eukprot:XP_019858154.1 PREDICTED: uncharacterized protein LOC109586413 [Amphimedon queenslandica]